MYNYVLFLYKKDENVENKRACNLLLLKICQQQFFSVPLTIKRPGKRSVTDKLSLLFLKTGSSNIRNNERNNFPLVVLRKPPSENGEKPQGSNHVYT